MSGREEATFIEFLTSKVPDDGEKTHEIVASVRPGRKLGRKQFHPTSGCSASNVQDTSRC